MVSEKLETHRQKNEVGPLLTPDAKLNPKWIKDLNVRAKTIEVLEEKGKSFMVLDSAIISWIQYQKHKQQQQKRTDQTSSKVKVPVYQQTLLTG